MAKKRKGPDQSQLLEQLAGNIKEEMEANGYDTRAVDVRRTLDGGSLVAADTRCISHVSTTGLVLLVSAHPIDLPVTAINGPLAHLVCNALGLKDDGMARAWLMLAFGNVLGVFFEEFVYPTLEERNEVSPD